MTSRSLLILLLATLFASCGPSGSSFRIKGKFHDMKAGELYIYNLSDDNPRLDTLIVRDGSFSYKGSVSQTTPFILVFPNGAEQVIFAGKGDDLSYEATANDLKNYVVNGSKENKIMNQFRNETYTYNPADVVNAALSCIKQNADSPVALYLFDTYFVNNTDISNKEVLAALNILKEKNPDNAHLADIEGRLSFSSRCANGKKMPDATLTRRNGTTSRLWSRSLDYNIIAFWATWKQNGYDVPWQLRQMNDAHRADGNLRIVTISLDIERNRWEDATRNDSTSTIEHYCDFLAFESPALKKLGISTVPFFVLADKSHNIISTSTTFDQLKTDVEKYVK